MTESPERQLLRRTAEWAERVEDSLLCTYSGPSGEKMECLLIPQADIVEMRRELDALLAEPESAERVWRVTPLEGKTRCPECGGVGRLTSDEITHMHGCSVLAASNPPGSASGRLRDERFPCSNGTRNSPREMREVWRDAR